MTFQRELQQRPHQNKLHISHGTDRFVFMTVKSAFSYVGRIWAVCVKNNSKYTPMHSKIKIWDVYRDTDCKYVHCVQRK